MQIANFKFSLLDHQIEGVEFLDDHNKGAYIADEQGLGKTVQITAFLQNRPIDYYPAIIVLPKTLILNWRNELHAMLGDRIKINIIGRKYSVKWIEKQKKIRPNVIYSYFPVPGCQIYLSTYHMVKTLMNDLLAINFKTIVCDEAHKLNNVRNECTKAVMYLTTGKVLNRYGTKVERQDEDIDIPHRVMSSGTPLINTMRDLWLTGNLLSQDNDFRTYNEFVRKYSEDVEYKTIKQEDGSTKKKKKKLSLQQLGEKIRSQYMIRRLKKDHMDVAKNYSVLPVDYDIKAYESLHKYLFRIGDVGTWKPGLELMKKYGANVNEDILPGDKGFILTYIQKMRQCAGFCKIEEIKNWIDEHYEENEKLLMFANHVSVVREIEKHVQSKFGTNSTGLVIGEISPEDRADYVARFQNDPTMRWIGCTVGSGGEGLTLTGTNQVLFAELPWTAAKCSQAFDRVHRIGQTKDVHGTFLVAADTIEDWISGIIIRKGKMMDLTLDDSALVNMIPELKPYSSNMKFSDFVGEDM